MDIVLPGKTDSREPVRLSNPHNIIIIGANGAGKSRFGREIERSCTEHVFRISAVNALSLQPAAAIKGKNGSISELFHERIQRSSRPVSEPDRKQEFFLTEFEKLLFLLQEEEFDSLIAFKEELLRDPSAQPLQTRLDSTQRLWEKIFVHSRIERRRGQLFIVPADRTDSYNALRMSQGEKVVFFLVAAALYAPANGMIIVEDPEVYLHRSIMGTLWDMVEECRPDCLFVYLTHDLEFAATRSQGVRIWVKAYDARNQTFDYELIRNAEAFPEEIYLELLGSRKPILFIEGTDRSSIDAKLYPHVFPEYLVKPLGGCNKVIETTKAFSEMKSFHHIESKGIVDRDRRTCGEVEYLRDRNIYVPDVAEVENLLMLEEVVRTVARRMMQSEDRVFETVRENVIRLFERDLEAQALLHARHRLRRKLEYMIDRRHASVDELAHHIETLTDGIDVRRLYADLCGDFRKYVRTADYNEVLRVYNQKSMLSQSRVTQLCGLTNKEAYLNLVLSMFKENRSDADRMRKAIRRCFGLERTE